MLSVQSRLYINLGILALREYGLAIAQVFYKIRSHHTRHNIFNAGNQTVCAVAGIDRIGVCREYRRSGLAANQQSCRYGAVDIYHNHVTV